MAREESPGGGAQPPGRRRLGIGRRRRAGGGPIRDFTTEFYAHPLIRGLWKGGSLESPRKGPSYIPAETFATAVLAILAERTGTAKGKKPTSAQIKRVPMAANTRGALMTLAEQSGPDRDSFRVALEGWFEASMARASGWYTRKTRRVVLLLAVLATIGLNINTIAIADRLSRDDVLRTTLATQAVRFVEHGTTGPTGPTGPSGVPGQPGPAGTSPADRLEAAEAARKRTKQELRRAKDARDDRKAERRRAQALGVPAGMRRAQRREDLAADKVKRVLIKHRGATERVRDARLAVADTKEQQNADKPIETATDLINRADDLGLPLGWSDGEDPLDFVDNPEWLLGWLLTIIALSLGAPFWFDTLSKLARIRSTGAPEAPSEAAKRPSPTPTE